MQIDDELSSLVRMRGRFLVRTAYQLSHDRTAAEDIVQEALLLVCRSWRRRSGQPDQLESYLRRAMVNVYLKSQRRQSRLPVLDVATLDAPETSGFADQFADRADLWHSLGRLSARQRTVLVLRFYEGLTDQEIAEMLNCRQATVRSLASRGLAALRTAVGEQSVPAAKEGRP